MKRDLHIVVKLLAGIAALGVIVATIDALLPYGAVAAILHYVPFGWWEFLKRNASEITVNWNLIGMALVCSAIVIVLTQYVLRALYDQISPERETNRSARWRWKWTFGLYASIWLLFGIAFGAGGMFRHIGWLATEKGGWYHARHTAYFELQMADSSLRELILDFDGEPDRILRHFRSKPAYGAGSNLTCEVLDVILYVNSTNRVEVYVVVPRDPLLLQQGVFAVSGSPERCDFRPLAELQMTLAELDGRFRSTQRSR